jgi:hypothetical protein
LAAVVEFGTVDKADIRRALRIDLSLRGASAAYTDDGAVEDARLRVVEAFFPSDPTWRTSLISLTDSLAGTLLKRDVVISAFL